MGRRRRQKSSEEEAKTPAPKLTSEFTDRLDQWAEEAAEASGLVLFDVVAQKNWVLTVFVDRDEAIEPGKGVSVDELTAVSRYLEAYLDADDAAWEHYTLEVSSPGVERKLTKPRHFELSVGRDVRFVLHEHVGNQNVIEGRLLSMDGEVLTVQSKKGEPVELNLKNIAKARLTYEFSE